MTANDKILFVLHSHTKEMEAYSYCSPNPGISILDYEKIADEILEKLNLKADYQEEG